MKKFYKVFRKSNFKKYTLLFFIGVLLNSIQTYDVLAQACPDLPGGIVYREINYLSTTQHYYPSSLPSGVNPSDPYNRARSTVGNLFLNDTLTTPISIHQHVIHPTLGTGATGSVVLSFPVLDLGTSGAIIKVYAGAGTGGVLLHTITSGNASSYTQLNGAIVYNGPLTFTFESPGNPSASGNFDVSIRFMTGDQVFDSAFDRKVAVWTSFIQPDSHTIVDDLFHIVAFGNGGNYVPISAAYFNSSRQFVSTEIAFCLEYNKDVPSLQNDYPGSLIFTKSTKNEYDIDDDGTYDSNVDPLKTARLMHILANNPASNRNEALNIQMAIWSILLNWSFNPVADSIVTNATNAVPSLPTPTEPTFSITPPSGVTTPGNSNIFKIDFDISNGFPTGLKLRISDGATIESVTGEGTYNPSDSVLTCISGDTATVFVTVKCNQPSTVSLTAIYEEEGFWNVNNLSIYEACNSDIQSFIGLTKKEIVHPFRTAQATWASSLPVTLSNFKARKEQSLIQLSWSTTKEINNKGFEILKSSDAKNWHSIGFVDIPNSFSLQNTTRDYLFADNQPFTGINYYKLKQIDKDGSFEYSGIQKTLFNLESTELVVYPNPITNGKATFKLPTNGENDIRLYTISGLEVMKINSSTNELNVSGVPQGIYTLRVKQDNDKVYNKLLVIQ